MFGRRDVETDPLEQHRRLLLLYILDLGVGDI